MKTVSLEQARAVWDWMCELSEAESRQLVDRMQQEQPDILVHLLAAEKSTHKRREPGWLLELGGFLWSALSRSGQPLRQVTGDDLDQAQAANEEYLIHLEEGSEMDWMDGVKSLTRTYNQTPLMMILLELLMAGNEETPELAGEDVGVGFLHLKTVLDCLDQ